MCGGSANRRCLPSTVNGERAKPGGVEATAGQGRGPGAERGLAGRRLEPDAVGGAAADDQEVPGPRGLAAAVAERVAAVELVHVEHGRRDVQRGAVAEPELGADPRPDLEVGVRRAELGELVVGEVADPDRGRAEAGGHDVVHQPVHLVEVGAVGERQVQGHAREAAAAADPVGGGRGARVRRSRAGACWSSARARTGRRAGRRAGRRRRAAGRGCAPRGSASAGSTSRAAPNGRHGVSTSRSPSNRLATSGSSSYVPTARVSTPSHWALRASRPRPKP